MIQFQQSESTAARSNLKPRRDTRLSVPNYNNTHKYITAHFGKALGCMNKLCTGKSKTFHWANKRGSFSRDITDYLSLCVTCHHYYDKHGQTLGKQKRKNAKSKFFGVTFRADSGRWRALIPANKLLNIRRRINIGTFATERDAAVARDNYILQFFPQTNIPLNNL